MITVNESPSLAQKDCSARPFRCSARLRDDSYCDEGRQPQHIADRETEHGDFYLGGGLYPGGYREGSVNEYPRNSTNCMFN